MDEGIWPEKFYKFGSKYENSRENRLGPLRRTGLCVVHSYLEQPNMAWSLMSLDVLKVQ